jgi:hypothetical protein
VEKWKYIGLAFNNKDWRVNKLGGNEFGEIHIAASQCFSLLPAFRKLAVGV